MTVIPGHPVYPATFPRIEGSSEGTDGSVAMVNVVLNMYAPAVVRTVDEHSYPRASRFAGSQISNKSCVVPIRVR